MENMMNRRWRQLFAAAIMLAVAVLCHTAAWASDDNSLASLGIKTQGASVSPEFRYDIWEYSVEVPAGTKTLELEPHTTNPSATVNSVTGTTLNDDGTGQVIITVTSESGNAIEYVLNITTARGAVDPAEAIAANESAAAVANEPEVVQSEVETEDPRYVKVDRNSLQDAENTIEKLQKTITEQRSHINMLTYVLYALIAVSIVFLFIVISQLLRRRDMAQELAFYKEADANRGLGAVAEDGWGDWGEEEADRSGRKKKKKQEAEDDWDDEPAGSAVSWTNQQVGTPVRPQNHPARGSQYPPGNAPMSGSGARAGQYPSGNAASRGRGQGGAPRQNGAGQRAQQGGAPRQNGAGQRAKQGGAPGQNGSGQRAQRQRGGRQGAGRQDTARQNAGRQNPGPADETKRYEAVQPVHPQEVPKDVTKDLTRMNKAEAKAMKKAAAAEAKRAKAEEAARRQEAVNAERAREEAARRQEAINAEHARAEEASRQAQEAERIAREQEAARQAQENALKEAAAQQAALDAVGGAAGNENAMGKNVHINMIDL